MPIFRLNIKASHFPLLSSHMGASIIQRQPGDSDYIVTDAYTGRVANNEIGIPDAIYMHNVMPTSFGYQSVDYKRVHQHLISEELDFNRIIPLRGLDEYKKYLVPAKGKNYIMDTHMGTFYRTAQSAFYPTNAEVTHAYINGRTLVAYANLGWLEYDPLSNSLGPIIPTGLAPEGVKGITNANNYNIAWDHDRVYWSSSVDPLDFTPSLTTGSGSGKPQAIRGAITCCLPIHDGFIIYTTQNAVTALWSGNALNPWIFREIPGSSGVQSPEHVSYEANYAGHFAWTAAGLQRVERNEAETIWPEITDFLAKREIEEWINGAPDIAGAQRFNSHCVPELHSRMLPEQVQVKVSFVSARFVAISYGDNQRLFSHCLVYDLALRRWGKLQIPHVDCFEYTPPGQKVAQPLESFGFLQVNGTIQTVDFSEQRVCLNSALIYGRLQYSRGAKTLLEEITLDYTADSNPVLHILSSYEGRQWDERTAPLQIHRDSLRSVWQSRETGEAHSLLITGNFSLATILVKVANRGRRS